MRLRAAMTLLVEEPEMEKLLDSMIPRSDELYHTVDHNVCKVCPVALYLSDKVGHPVYVGWTSAFMFTDRSIHMELPGRIYDYVRIGTPKLLEVLLP